MPVVTSSAARHSLSVCSAHEQSPVREQPHPGAYGLSWPGEPFRSHSARRVLRFQLALLRGSATTARLRKEPDEPVRRLGDAAQGTLTLSHELRILQRPVERSQPRGFLLLSGWFPDPSPFRVDGSLGRAQRLGRVLAKVTYELAEVSWFSGISAENPKSRPFLRSC
jgi:hypothetical protein